jgi:hypothetical protein
MFQVLARVLEPTRGLEPRTSAHVPRKEFELDKSVDALQPGGSAIGAVINLSALFQFPFDSTQ